MWAATTTVLVTISSHALGLVARVAPAITTAMNETAKEPDTIRRLNQATLA